MVFILSMGTTISLGQINRSDLVSKIWICFLIEEADGEKYEPPEEMKNDYVRFDSNGTYISLESGNTLLKGFWAINEKDSFLLTRQTQTKEYPSEDKIKILKLTKNELVIERIDGGGDKLKIYFKPK